MAGNLTFDDLKKAAKSGEIDTVLVALVDMQGRLMGKRFHVSNFIETAHKETHACNYLLATDIAMEPVEGYKSTSWESGYGDYTMKPDMSTLRHIPWFGAVRCAKSSHSQRCAPFASRAFEKANRPFSEYGHDADDGI